MLPSTCWPSDLLISLGFFLGGDRKLIRHILHGSQVAFPTLPRFPEEFRESSRMGYRKFSETLDRSQGYASISDAFFRSMIMHTFFANISRIQDSLMEYFD